MDYDFLRFLGTMLITIFVVIGGLFGSVILIDSSSCKSYGARTGQQIDWSLTNGCMVNVNGVWKPSKNTLEVVR